MSRASFYGSGAGRAPRFGGGGGRVMSRRAFARTSYDGQPQQQGGFGGGYGPQQGGFLPPQGPPPMSGGPGGYGPPFQGGPPLAAGPPQGPGCGMWSANCGGCEAPSSRFYVSAASVPPALGYVDKPITYQLCATLFPFQQEFYYMQPKSCYSSCSSNGSNKGGNSCFDDDERDNSNWGSCGSDRCRPRRRRHHKSDRNCCTERQGYGSAKISITINRCTNTARVEGRVDYFKLSSAVRGVQIRGPSDPYRHDLCGPVMLDVGNLYSTSATCDLDNYVSFNATIVCQEAENILLGRYFIQVNTCDYRNGELKGRLVNGGSCC